MRSLHRATAVGVAAILLFGSQGTLSPAGERGRIEHAEASQVPDWHLAASLVKLRKEVNARWPRRDRSWDGAIGDVYHRRGPSSHNPVGYRNGPDVGTKGSVHSIDLTAAGIDVDDVLRAVIGDARVWYVIHDARIWSRTTGWTPRKQPGDPHRMHIHVTLLEHSQRAATKAENDTSRWLKPRAARGSALKPPKVRAIQRALIRHGFGIPAGPTGKYGAQTTRAMTDFQRAQGWRGEQADGQPGPLTLKRLGLKGNGKKSQAKGGSAKKSGRARKAGDKKGTRAGEAAESKRAKAAKKAAAEKRRNVAKVAEKKRAKNGTTRAGKAAEKKHAKETRKAAAEKRRNVAKAAEEKRAKAAKKIAEKKLAKGATNAADSAANPPPLAAEALVPGTASVDVHHLQVALIEAGFSIPAGPTGYFGVRTRKAVRKLQREQGWRGKEADGIPGPGTLRLLGLRTR